MQKKKFVFDEFNKIRKILLKDNWLKDIFLNFFLLYLSLSDRRVILVFLSLKLLNAIFCLIVNFVFVLPVTQYFICDTIFFLVKEKQTNRLLFIYYMLVV